MANLHRLIFFALLFVVSSANASFSVPTGWNWTFGAANGFSTSFGQACQAGVANLSSQQPCVADGTCTITPVPDEAAETCYAKRETSGGITLYQIYMGRNNTCPANSTASGSTCTCSAGFFERVVDGATSCVKPDDRTPEQLCEDAAMLYNSTLNGDRSMRIPGTLSSSINGVTVCHDMGGVDRFPSGKGCKHTFTGDLGFTDDKGKSWVNGFSFALDANDKAKAGGSLLCDASDNQDSTDPKTQKPPPADCINGYKGSVNGIEICVEASTGNTEGVDWTRTRDAEGNESDGKTTVKCDGDQCTVTETKTTKKPDGITSTSTTTTENVNRQGYCARNPQSSICGRKEDKTGGTKNQDGGGRGGGGSGDGDGEEEASTFGGACLSGFTCGGDAIQCAIAKEQHIRACKLFDDSSPESELYQANKGKEGNQTLDLPGNETVNISGRIDTSDALGGGSTGVADLNVTVWGQSITLPFSMLNPYLAALGNVLLAVSFLLALRIVARG